LTGLDRLAAQAQGFVPLVERALQFAMARVTTVDEVMRNMAGLEGPERKVSLLDDVLSGEAVEPSAADASPRLVG
jgi:hypothetical protein